MTNTFNILLVTSWSEVDQKKTVLWANELERRGHDITVLSPTPLSTSVPPNDEVQVADIASLVGMGSDTPSPNTVENRFEIDSLPLVCHTERAYFGLGYGESIERACEMAPAIDRLCEKEAFDYGIQIRGPEIHRLLTHYVLNSHRGTMIWMDFSPFDGRFAISTNVRGTWGSYRTIPYGEISQSDRRRTREHIEAFRERSRFFAHDESGRPTLVSKVLAGARALVGPRERPGTRRAQVSRRLARIGRRHTNAALLPSVERSRRMCRDTEYVFLPYQYPIESRLTVFAPQFYRQEYLIEYLGRVLPASVRLFVKPHPNHPDRPSPEFVHSASEEDRVQFLNPTLNAHEVIESAEAVVVTNNTVGFETLYYGKPLFTLGGAPYGATPAAIDVTDLGDLPRLFRTHIPAKIPEEATIESIHSLRAASMSGDRTSTDEEDIRTLVDSIEQCTADIE